MKSKAKKILNRAFSILLTALVAIGSVGASGMNNIAYAFATFTGSSPFSGVAYSSYYHNKDKFNGRVILHGVDVSEYQSSSKSNWNTAWDNKVDFAILRVTWTGYGSAGNKVNDVNFAEHYKKAKAAGQLVGVYVFSQACSNAEAKAEAEFAVKRLKALGIGPKDLNLPVYMDYEFAGPSKSGRMHVAKRNGKLTKAMATEYAKTFCKTIKSYGYTPGIYASTAFLWNTIDGTALGKSYDIWAAQYWNKCEFEGGYTKWQYSSAAKINGIYNSSGKTMNTDVDFWYVKKNRTASSSTSNDIANCKITCQSTVKYTGSKLKPKVTVKKDGKTLKEGTDYSVGYVRNKKVGTAYAFISGIGTYWNYQLIPFTISKTGETVVENKPVETETYDPINKYVKLSQDASKFGYTLTSTALSKVVKGSTAEGAKKAVVLKDDYDGYTIKAVKTSTGAALSNSTKVVTGNSLAVFNSQGKKVAQTNMNVTGTATVTLSTTSYIYNNEDKKPKATIKFNSVTAGTGLQIGNEYCSIVYPDELKLPGTHTVTVKGKGLFAGSYTADYKINVQTTSLSSVTPTKKAGFVAKWTQQKSTRVTGYQLQYSRYSDMRLDLKDTIKSYKTTSKTVKDRYSGYKYYVRVRCYKVINGKKYYSPWSAKKTVNVA